MSDEEFRGMRFNEKKNRRTKQCKALAIDGIEAGMIMSLPKFQDEKVLIFEDMILAKKIIQNCETRNAVPFFLRLCGS